MKIPEVQQNMLGIAMNLDRIGEDHNFPELFREAKALRALVPHLNRRVATGPRVKSSRSVLDVAYDGVSGREAIRKFKADNPNFSQHQIAQHFNVIGGRVSEALKGFRT